MRVPYNPFERLRLFGNGHFIRFRRILASSRVSLEWAHKCPNALRLSNLPRLPEVVERHEKD
jgi:hypothetical protein